MEQVSPLVTYDQFNGSRITCRGEDKRSSVVAGMGYLQKPSVCGKIKIKAENKDGV